MTKPLISMKTFYKEYKHRLFGGSRRSPLILRKFLLKSFQICIFGQEFTQFSQFSYLFLTFYSHSSEFSYAYSPFPSLGLLFSSILRKVYFRRRKHVHSYFYFIIRNLLFLTAFISLSFNDNTVR